MKLFSASAWVLSLLVLTAPAAAQRPLEPAAPPSAAAGSDDVPAAIAARVRTMAETSSRLRPMAAAARPVIAEPRTAFIGVDLVRRKGDRGRDLAPYYRVQHYRYADDTTITSLVDLETGRVAEQVEARHAPVRLGDAELAEARSLALADRRVAAAVGRYMEQLLVEPLLVRTSDPNDPWYARRVVRLLFRVGADYLTEPVVYVDLTGREVIIHEAHRPRQGD
jgi:hypothetical protein